MTESADSHDRSLRNAALLLIAGFIVHNSDHARRGLDNVRESLVWAGTLTMTLAAVIVTLILTRHHLGPAVAAAGGFAIALGVMSSHLLPDWGPISDSLPQGDVDAFTWIAVFSEILAALWMGWVGLGILRRNNFELGTASASPARAG